MGCCNVIAILSMQISFRKPFVTCFCVCVCRLVMVREKKGGRGDRREDTWSTFLFT